MRKEKKRYRKMGNIRQHYIVVQVVHCAIPESKFTLAMIYTIICDRAHCSTYQVIPPKTIYVSQRLSGKENWEERMERRILILLPLQQPGAREALPLTPGQSRDSESKGTPTNDEVRV